MRAALAFLTVVPLPRGRSAAPGRAALLAFPLVGALLGLAWAGTAWAAEAAWGPLAAAGMVVALDLLVTGALHADAFADVVDGVASGKPAAEAITIMRQPAIGAVGAAVLVAALLVRFGWITVLVSNRSWWLLAVVPACGRTAFVWMLARGSSAPSSLAGGLAAVASVRLGIIVAAEAAVLCALFGRVEGVAAVLLALVVAEGAHRFWAARFGGLVGDAVGACGFLAETAALGLVSAL
ncbi:MAG: adenosylcobinamide-GDP ribazoletransferase [Thermoleophilaceae bacterium]